MRTSGLFLPQRHGCIVGLSIEARQAPRECEVSGEEDSANAMGEIQKDTVPLQIEGGVGFREHGNTVRGWREKVVICKDLEE